HYAQVRSSPFAAAAFSLRQCDCLVVLERVRTHHGNPSIGLSRRPAAVPAAPRRWPCAERTCAPALRGERSASDTLVRQVSQAVMFVSCGGDQLRLAPAPTGAGRILLYRILGALLVLVSFAARGEAQSQVATVTLTPGWATFGQALPQGAATGALQVGGLSTQTDVKTTWPDGSIRFAIVTVNASGAATYPIVAAVPSSGTFSPALPAASVDLAIAGVAYTAAL